MSTLHVWRYTLRSVAALNPVSARTEHEGALIRVNDGYGCLHPWPELGDATLKEQLETLASGRSTPLIGQALRCADLDGTARREGRSLFAGRVPESHWLVLPGDDPETVKEAGFDCVKLKIGGDSGMDVQRAMRWGGAGFRLRFDGNEKYTVDDFLYFWESIEVLWNQVDLVEDPVPWDPVTWGRLGMSGVPLAVDRLAEDRFRKGCIVIIKPAMMQWIPPGNAPFLVTSYMDHALGQVWAAAEACRLSGTMESGRLLKCGLLTQRCFEPDPFFEQVRSVGTRLLPPDGTGLGFDDLLEKLPWKRLT